MKDTNLPRWVWDLVISLQKDEEQHPGLSFQRFDGEWVRSEWCPTVVLARIPEAVRDTAAILADLLPPPGPEVPAPEATDPAHPAPASG